METEELDAKTAEESSPSTATTATESTDVQTESSPAKDATKTVDEIVAEVKAKHGVDSDSSPEKKEASSVVLKENATEKAAEEKESTSAVTKDEDLPFHKHPRFQELITEKNRLTAEYEQAKPLAERTKQLDTFMAQNRVTQEDLNQSLQIVAKIKADPKTALQMLQPIVEALRVQTGEALPADLQKQVDEGVMPEALAREVSQLRAQNKLAESRVQLSQQEVQRSAQAAQQQQLVQALDSWTLTKKTSDPDFAPKGKPTDADGKFEMTFAKFLQYWNTIPVSTMPEAVALLDRAYNEVQGFVQRLTPPPPKRRVVTSNGSATTKAIEKIDTTKAGWGRQVAASFLASRE